METLFQIVGCIASSQPDAVAIDAFVAEARLERAAVVGKNALGATFVRFNAVDARLLVLAGRRLASTGGGRLRFGFAAAVKDPTTDAKDGTDISQRSIAQATELAAAAIDGELLISPVLAMLLSAAGFHLVPRQWRLPKGGTGFAAELAWRASSALLADPDARPVLEHRVSEAMGSRFLELLTRVDAGERRQTDLEHKLDQALAAMIESRQAMARHDEREAKLQAQSERLDAQLKSLGELEGRLDMLGWAMRDAEGQLSLVNSQQQAVHADRLGQLQTLSSSFEALADKLSAAQQALVALGAGQTDAQMQSQALAARVQALALSIEQTDQSTQSAQARLQALEQAGHAFGAALQSLAARAPDIDAAKHQVASLQALAAQGQQDLERVSGQQQELSSLRSQLDALLSLAQETETQMARVEQRRVAVEEVHARASAVTHLVDDFKVQLELMNDQQAAIDDVGDRLSRLDYMLRECQNTLRALQREREMAVVIEQGLKGLRTRSPV